MNGNTGRKMWMMIALALAWLTATSARAADPLEARVDMTVRDAAVDDTFRTFAKMFNAEAVVDPALKGAKVTVELKNVRVRTLLDTVCESIGCRWDLQPGNPPKLRVSALPAGKPAPEVKAGSKEPIDLRVNKAKGQEILKTFGQILSAEVVVDSSIDGTVTLDLENTPWDQALDAVCAALGCNWELIESPMRVLKVVPKNRKI
jgi:type II secretory pathway component GspD/PulD (secretin)